MHQYPTKLMMIAEPCDLREISCISINSPQGSNYATYWLINAGYQNLLPEFDGSSIAPEQRISPGP